MPLQLDDDVVALARHLLQPGLRFIWAKDSDNLPTAWMKRTNEVRDELGICQSHGGREIFECDRDALIAIGGEVSRDFQN